jgi:hypothetical protein
MKNKKATLGATIPLIVATIVIMFILVIFFYFSSALADFKFKKHAEVVADYSSKEQASISLEAFLKTPIKIILDSEEVEITLADLIRFNEVKAGGDTILKEQAEKIFKPFGKCYFFKKKDVEAGNSAFKNELAVLILPVDINRNVEVGLAVNSKCLEGLK